jgi:hypothetical protein
MGSPYAEARKSNRLSRIGRRRTRRCDARRGGPVRREEESTLAGATAMETERPGVRPLFVVGRSGVVWVGAGEAARDGTGRSLLTLRPKRRRARRDRAAGGDGRRLGPMPRDWLLRRGSCGEGAPGQAAKPEGSKSAVEILPRFSCRRAIHRAERLGGRKMAPTAARYRLQACADRLAPFGAMARFEPFDPAW